MDINSMQRNSPKGEAARKKFQLGHMASQLRNAGEPEQTIQNITNGTYSPADPILCNEEESSY